MGAWELWPHRYGKRSYFSAHSSLFYGKTAKRQSGIPVGFDWNFASCDQSHRTSRINYHESIRTKGKQRRDICPKRKALLRKLTGALEDVLSLYRQQQQAALADDPKYIRFDPTIERRLRKAKAALEAYSKHVREHGC